MLFVYKHYSEKGSIGLTKLPKEAMAQNKTLHIEDRKDISRRSLDTEQMHGAEPPPTTTNPLWSMTWSKNKTLLFEASKIPELL